MIIPVMKKDEGEIEQEKEEEEKPQFHILPMTAQTDMLVHTEKL